MMIHNVDVSYRTCIYLSKQRRDNVEIDGRFGGSARTRCLQPLLIFLSWRSDVIVYYVLFLDDRTARSTGYWHVLCLSVCLSVTLCILANLYMIHPTAKIVWTSE